MNTTPIISYQELADGSIRPFSNNLQAYVVNAESINDYLAKLQELTGGEVLEWNDTLRQKAGKHVYFSYNKQDVTNCVETLSDKCGVFEIIPLTDGSVLLNNGGRVISAYPESEDKIYLTKDDAVCAFNVDVMNQLNCMLDTACDHRRELRAELNAVSNEIHEMVEFKKKFS